MTSQIINKMSKERFGDLMSSVGNVRFALDEAVALVKDYDPELDAGALWLALPDEDELKGMLRKSEDALSVFRRALKEWEVKLIANGWKV